MVKELLENYRFEELVDNLDNEEEYKLNLKWKEMSSIPNNRLLAVHNEPNYIVNYGMWCPSYNDSVIDTFIKSANKENMFGIQVIFLDDPDRYDSSFVVMEGYDMFTIANKYNASNKEYYKGKFFIKDMIHLEEMNAVIF